MSKQRTSLPWTPGAAALFVGGAFLLGRWSAWSPHPLPSGASAATVAVRPSDAPTPPTRSQPPPSAAVAARWSALAALPPWAAPEDDAAQFLEELATRDPPAALRCAQTEATWRRRNLYIRAALRGWASHAPVAASQWMLANVRSGERREAAEAISAGAAKQPDAAIDAAQWLCRSDPALAADYGTVLITQLARAGAPERGAEFALGGTAAERSQWLACAYFEWAQRRPEQALASLARLSDPDALVQARQSLCSGWATSDPRALVAYAHPLRDPELRRFALREGLVQWVTTDPVAATEWMERLEAGEEFDTGASAVATTVELVARNPQLALTWARSIKDPDRRSTTLAEVLRQWASRDASGARDATERSADLSAADRNALLAEFDAPTPPTS